MLIPVRCFSCGKVISGKWRAYQEKTNNNEGTGAAKAAAMASLGIDRYCCKRMFLSHVDLIEHL